MVNIGDIYLAKIHYRGHSGTFKTRPVLVLDVEVNYCTIAEITSVAPKNPPSYYDNFKEKINGWQSYGLDSPSYVKCKNIHKVLDLNLNSKLGAMDFVEFERIVNIINDID